MNKFLKNNKAKIGPLTLIVIILVISVGAALGTYFWLAPYLSSENPDLFKTPETTPEGYHVGPITLYNYHYWTYDDSAQSSSIPTVKFYHADKSNVIGTIASSTVTGQLLTTDKDIIYMATDYGSNTGYFVDPAATKLHGEPYIKDYFPWDHDHDTTLEWGFTVNLKDLPNLSAGQQSWVATINLYLTKADTLTQLYSITNVTGASHTVGNDYYTSMYMGYTGEGYTIKLAYFTVTTANSGSNATYITNSTFSLKEITIVTGQGQTYPMSGTTIGAFDDATNKTKVYPVADYTNEVNDISAYNWRGGGGSSNTITLHWSSLKWPGGHHRILLTLTVYYINPTGNFGNATQVIELRDSYA